MPRKDVIGIDVGGTNVRAAVVRDERLGEVRSIPIDPAGSAEEVLQQICGLIDELPLADVDGIGIGVPSVVDLATGVVYDVQNIPSWKEVPLKAILEDRYARPVLVNNDANCFALGEHHFGKGVGCPSLIGLIVGTGFAGGVIVGGRLYPGRNCGAGEFGMLPYLDGIFEQYCSGQFFPRRVGRTGEEVFRQAVAGDGEAVNLFAEFGRHVGEGVKAVLFTYDPELIVLGGSVRKAFRFFQEAMWESIRSFAYANSLRSLRIELSELDHIAVLGAAALHYDAALTGG